MKTLRKTTLLFLTITAGLLIFTSSGCEKEDELINEEYNQYSRDVDKIPTFNGASCLVCIDVHDIGGAENLKWVYRAKDDSTVPQWSTTATEAAIIQEINQKIANCPPGSNVKLQFKYHYDAKKQYHQEGKLINLKYDWYQHKSVEAVLKQLAQAGNTRITKVYLTSCSSHDRTSTANAAFGLPNVTNVVTVNKTILLGCGEIAGAEWPSFQPDGVKVIVWKKEGNKQIAQIPKNEVGKDKKFDIGTNKVVPR